MNRTHVDLILVALCCFILAHLSFSASAAITPTGKTWSEGELETGADGESWTNLAPGNVPSNSQLFLAFSDLISGPDTGLGDGLGSGVIVTVWGFGLGATQGDSTIEFCDSAAQCRAGHVYYWKNADGALPGGPANLFESHGMQEIAFSIPDSAQGAGNIRVTVNAETSTLPFTVRSGSIYHVKSTGNDSTGNGSWGSPWRTVAKADSTVNSGSTIYIGSLTEGTETTDKAIYNNRGEADSSLAAQFAYVAYPNSRVDVIGHRGVSSYNGGPGLEGIVVSKLSVYAAEADLGANDQPTNDRAQVSFGIQGSKNGRAVGNYVTDEHPSDSSGACANAQQGAVYADALDGDRVSNFKMIGNHIADYGCYGSTKFHHTTYFTIRSGSNNLQLVAPEIAYNYLSDNHAKNGLHYYDENLSGVECGQFTTTFKIHNNVIHNQAGTGIYAGAGCPVSTQFDIYQNITINTGLKVDWDGVSGASNGPQPSAISFGAGSDFTSTVNIFNNIFYKWNDDDEAGDVNSCVALYGSGDGLTFNFDDNICFTDKDKAFIKSNYQGPALEDNFTGGTNVWYTSAGSQTNAVAPSWDATKITTDPLLMLNGSKFSVGGGSPVIGQSTTTLVRDIYGANRAATSNVGAVQ